jgi:pimeloyl-ACP methyl ester carboxylesterase
MLGATGCTDLMLARYRDDAFLQNYHYVLGEQYLVVEGLRVCYQELGQGDTVVILPGLATSIDFWQLTIPELAKRYHVIAIDPPGFGKSDKPEVAYDLSWLCDQIVAFMDAKEIHHASFIGGSLGGQLAMLIALSHPERVDSLVLMGSSGAWPAPGFLLAGALVVFWNDAVVVDHMRRNWPQTFRKMFLQDGPVVQRLFHYQMSMRANIRAYWREGRASSRSLRSIFFHSCLMRLREVRRPVLLVWGEHDQIHLGSEALALRAGLPDSRLVVVPDAGHEVMLDQPGAFNRVVLDFLQDGTSAVSDAIPTPEGARRTGDGHGSPS